MGNISLGELRHAHLNYQFSPTNIARIEIVCNTDRSSDYDPLLLDEHKHTNSFGASGPDRVEHSSRTRSRSSLDVWPVKTTSIQAERLEPDEPHHTCQTAFEAVNIFANMLPYINAPFDFLSEIVGAPRDDLKLVSSWVLSYPLAAVLKTIPDKRPELKNIYVICVSAFYLVGLFDLWGGLRSLLVSSFGTYCIAKFFRQSPLMPWMGFVFTMGHLSLNQISRQMSGNPLAFDITGAHMVLVMKLSAFCWNVADGLLPDDNLTEYQRTMRLKDLPSLLDFAGWVFFFPALLAGPTLEFADYSRFLDTSMFDLPPNLEASKKPPVRKRRKIPRSGTPAAWKAAAGLTWIAIFVPMSGRFDHSVLTDPSFLDYGFLRRVWILYCVGFTARTKYYGAWSLAEGACVVTGLGYNGVDPITGKVSWNRLQNIEPLSVELAQNVRGYLGGWNMNTNKWLRNYVYLRVTPQGKKPGFRASLITFSTSALWHGFYPGYYMTFVLASLVQTVAKNFRRQIRPFFVHPLSGLPTSQKRYYDILSFLVTQTSMSFAVVPFLTLTLSASLTAWSRVYFFVPIGVVLSQAFFSSPARQYLKKKLESRSQRPGIQMARSLSQDSLIGREPVLGVAQDPERELDEAMQEMRADIDDLRYFQKSKLKVSSVQAKND